MDKPKTNISSNPSNNPEHVSDVRVDDISNTSFIVTTNDDPTIGCHIIARNNEDSIGPLITKLITVFDEVVVLDTGSTDRTVHIAYKNGAQVFHYGTTKGWTHQFIDDFAKARNEALSKLTTDWTIWFDSDDFPSLRTLWDLRKVIFECSPDYDAIGTLYTIKKTRTSKSFFVQFPKTRAWRKESEYHWIGRVHEEIIGPMNKMFLVPLSIPTTHINEKSRGKRNLIIFEDMIEKGEPLRKHDSFYIAREYKNHGMWNQAFYWAEKYIADKPDNLRNLANAYIFLGMFFDTQKNRTLARQHYLKAIEIEDRIPNAYLKIGEQYIADDNYAQALPWFLHAYNLQPIDIRETNYYAERTFIPLGYMAIAYLMLGNVKNAEIMYMKALDCEPDDEFLNKYRDLFIKVKEVEK